MVIVWSSNIQAGQPELIALEKAVKAAMDPAGTAREVDFGREVPLFEVEATDVEPEFEKLYSYLFDIENGGYPIEEIDRPRPTAIFVVNFDKVRIDPRSSQLDLDSLMYGRIPPLTEEELKNQEGGYIYRYRYNGGGASQIWLGSGRLRLKKEVSVRGHYLDYKMCCLLDPVVVASILPMMFLLENYLLLLQPQ